MINKLNRKSNKGFTLVELLVVIAIIGILAVVAVPSLFKQIDKSRAAKVESNYSAIKNAVAAKYTEGGNLQSIEDLDGALSNSSADNISSILEIDGLELSGLVYEINVQDQNTAVLEVSGLTDNLEELLELKVERVVNQTKDNTVTFKIMGNGTVIDRETPPASDGSNK